MKNLILALGILLTLSSRANDVNGGINPISTAEKMQTWIAAHVEYPTEALTNNEEGTVYVTFTIADQGMLANVEIAQGISETLDNAALETVLKMPVSELISGSEKQNTVYIVPIKFVIK